VCEIFADEVEKGNRANTHLNKAGYKNVIQRFKERTGIDYDRKQFKNKWDKLKVDYSIWKKLTNNKLVLDGMKRRRTLTCLKAGGRRQSKYVHLRCLFISNFSL
jgi:hypothetical protein